MPDCPLKRIPHDVIKTITPFLTALALSLDLASTYYLQEWGTFTTVAGSDGILLTGFQREEVALPAFVHSHFGFENGQNPAWDKFAALAKSHGFVGFGSGSKGLGQRPLSGVTVKMETPVIYFHSDKAFHAQIHVGFEGGTISQWYSNRSGGETLHLKNHSGGDISYLLVFQQDGSQVSRSARPAGLKSGESMDLAESTLTPAACGLLEAEAKAMVQTWWTSYFESEGLRVFWVLPTPVTDRILPLTITPPPDEIVRVLVGRSEVLRPLQETTWLTASRVTGDEARSWNSTIQTDRFALAIQQRVTALRSTHEHEARLNAKPEWPKLLAGKTP